MEFPHSFVPAHPYQYCLFGPILRTMTNTNSFDLYSSFGLSERLLPRRELRRLVPVSDMTIWRWERGGVFPRHLSINGRNYWRLSEIMSWIARPERAFSSRAATDGR